MSAMIVRFRLHFIFGTFLLPLIFGTPSMALAEEMKVVKIYQGDAGKFVSASGRPLIFHLAGCTAPSPKDTFGPESLASLARLINQKKVNVIIIRKESEHALVKMKIGQMDPCLEQLRVGMAEFKASDSDALGAVEKAGYPLAANRSRIARRGIWGSGDGIHFTESPELRMRLHEERYEQEYLNGTPNPANSGFDRVEAPPPQEKPKAPNDWRKKRVSP